MIAGVSAMAKHQFLNHGLVSLRAATSRELPFQLQWIVWSTEFVKVKPGPCA